MIHREQATHEVTVEIKARSTDSGFKSIKEWLGDHEMLMIIEDRKKPLCVLDYDFFKFLVDNFEPKDNSKLKVNWKEIPYDVKAGFPFGGCRSDNVDLGNSSDSVQPVV